MPTATATAEDIAALELLAVELELSRAVSVVHAVETSVVAYDRDRPIALSERAVVWDRPLVVHDAPRFRLGDPPHFAVAFESWRKAELEIRARVELVGR